MRLSILRPAGIAVIVLLSGTRCQPAGSSPAPAASAAARSPATSSARVPARPARQSGDRCTVSTVHDGDTLRCTDGRKIRVLGIDAPEIDQPEGAAARQALQRLAPRGTVLRVESDLRPLDDFNRTLAYLWLDDGRMVNEELLRAGMVVTLTYPPNVRYVERLRAAQAEARRSSAGLWASGGFSCMPKAHRQGRC